MSAVTFAVAQQITMEYDDALSEARVYMLYKEKCQCKIVAYMQLRCVDTTNGNGICQKILILSQENF